MKNRLLKFTAVFCALCIIGSAALCVKARKSVIKTGLTDMTTTDAALLASAHIQESCVLTANDETRYISSLEAAYDQNIEQLDSVDTILVVEATGDLCQYRSSLEQRATVVDVIRCPEKLKPGDEIRIFRLMGFIYENGIAYCHSENIMYPGSRYLIFMNSSSLNAYTGSRDYNVGYWEMNYFKLDRSSAYNVCPSYDFAACKDVVHFTSSDEIAAAISEYEECVIERFYGRKTEG